MAFCSRQEAKYYLKNKWRTSSGGLFRLKNSPKKITEYFYSHVDSLSQETFPVKGSTDEYFFNSDGDLTQRNFLFNNLISRAIYRYSAKGYVMELESPQLKGIAKKTMTNFEQNINGKFIETSQHDGYKREKWYEYKNNGQEIITEEYVNTSETKRSSVVRDHLFYNGDYLVKQVRTSWINEEMQSRTQVYFYNPDNYLDSIISVYGRVTKRFIYIKNKYGDPVAQYEVNGKDTTEHNRFSYLYDNKGNWIRRFEEQIKGPVYFPKGSNALVIRKIEY